MLSIYLRFYLGIRAPVVGTKVSRIKERQTFYLDYKRSSKVLLRKKNDDDGLYSFPFRQRIYSGIAGVLIASLCLI